jgi:hypothetical protein
LLMIVKGRLEKWDTPSVRFCTRELFMKFYKVSEGGGLCELYEIFKDLFCYAYSQRRRLIGSMIEVFQLLLFESWVPNYDVERGEKAAKVLLRLGADFLNRGQEISDGCLTAIDDLAGDMFEPEILSKEILLGAKALEKISEKASLKDFVQKTADWIGTNDRYAWDDENKTYLLDAIDYAEWEQGKYEVDIADFKQNYLIPALDQNIKTDMQEYVDFLGELETGSDRDLAFPAELLGQMILAYEFLRPNVHNEIKKQVAETNDNNREKLFKRIVDSNNFLSRVYGKSDMITTVSEFIRFLENNAETEGLPVGTTTYGISFVNFKKKLRIGEIAALEKIVQKYGLQNDSE